MRLLGLEEAHRGYVEAYHSLCIFTAAPRSAIEFVIPDGGVLLEFNGGNGGLHHIALAVASLSEATRELEEQGVSLLEPQPVKGGGDFICNFVPPLYTRGVIVELVQPLVD